MSNKVKTTNDIQNQNNQNMLKFWQGTETEWNEQNISSHEDYLSFIEDVGVKIGDKLIIKNNKKITSTNDPSTLKFGDRIDNKATVVGTFESSDLGTVVFAVLDAQYRGNDIQWSIYYTNILTNYSSVPIKQNIYSSTHNTNICMNADDGTGSNYPAFKFARNITTLNFNKETYIPQLPNAYELQSIYDKKDELDELDPTKNDYSSYALNNWGFYGNVTGNFNNGVYSSNMKDMYGAWILLNNGNWYSSKMEGGVIPIIEIPIQK